MLKTKSESLGRVARELSALHALGERLRRMSLKAAVVRGRVPALTPAQLPRPGKARAGRRRAS